MTFISHKVSREAQNARNARRDKKGRAVGKYATPDRPGTNLAYSVTGKGNGSQGDMAAALKAAGLAPERKPRRKPKGPQKPRDTRPKSKPKGGKSAPAHKPNPSAAAAMRRIAGKGGNPSDAIDLTRE